VLVTAAVVQVTLLDLVRVDGVSVELLLLVSVMAGRHGGPDRGAVVAFCAGLLQDSVVGAPLGLHALVFAPAAALVGHLSVRLAEGARALAAIGLVGVLFIGVVGATGVGSLFGLHGTDGLTVLRTALIASTVTATVGVPVGRVMGWAVTGGLPVEIDLRDGTPTGLR